MKLNIQLNLPDNCTYGQALDAIAMQLAWTEADRKSLIWVGDGNINTANPIRTGTTWSVTE